MLISYNAIVVSVTDIIIKTKGVKPGAVQSVKSLKALGIDQLDLVNVILALEKEYSITVPDELPLETVQDLVWCVWERTAA